MNSTVKMHTLTYTDYRTYLFAAVFMLANILLPQLFHAVPKGGLIFLPIYFFTLIAAYRFGLVTGLLTGILSPLISHLLFGMPPLAVLPFILIKSVLLVIAAVVAAKYFSRVSISALFCVVLAYQLVGTLVEWMVLKDLNVAFQDFRIGIPGMLLQIFGGYLLLKTLPSFKG